MAGAASLALSKSDFYREIGKSQQLINEIYKQIFVNYVDELDPAAFTKASIHGMTKNLDPYSVYLEDEDLHSINLLAKGKYGGIGIELGLRNKKLSVISPMDGGPAKMAGILSGDVILKIDEHHVEDISLNEAANFLRGKKGTSVVLTIKRFSQKELLTFNLIRSTIDVKDVTYSNMLNESTGYVRLNRFSLNAGSAMRSALQDLLNQNAHEIIIDLRNNPGGLLNAAVSILDLLIPKGEVLVTTKGRTKDSNKTFISRRSPIVPEDVKIVVLINQGSASASEIVSGTIQDLDRGLILGEKSFGKGLVQRVFGIDNYRSLKITTAKYYIPSGRLIQKRDYIDNKYVLNKVLEDSVFYTQNGRMVAGGGGITPDSTIKSKRFSVLANKYSNYGIFFSFAQKFKYDYKNLADVINDDLILQKFKTFTDSLDIPIQLPGEENFKLLQQELHGLDSSNVQTNQAFSVLSDFYETQTDVMFQEESEKLKEILFVEFAGMIDGTEGRIKQILKNDNVLNTALAILESDLTYELALSQNAGSKKF